MRKWCNFLRFSIKKIIYFMFFLCFGGLFMCFGGVFNYKYWFLYKWLSPIHQEIYQVKDIRSRESFDFRVNHRALLLILLKNINKIKKKPEGSSTSAFSAYWFLEISRFLNWIFKLSKIFLVNSIKFSSNNISRLWLLLRLNSFDITLTNLFLTWCWFLPRNFLAMKAHFLDAFFKDFDVFF